MRTNHPNKLPQKAKQQGVTDTRGTDGGPTLHDRQLAGNARQRSTSISGRARFPSFPPIDLYALPTGRRSRASAYLPARRRPSPPPNPAAPAGYAAPRPRHGHQRQLPGTRPSAVDSVCCLSPMRWWWRFGSYFVVGVGDFAEGSGHGEQPGEGEAPAVVGVREVPASGAPAQAI